MKKMLVALSGASLALALAACGGSDGSSGDNSGNSGGEPQQGGTLTLVTNTDINTWDPATKCGAGESGYMSCEAVFGSLLRADPETGEYAGYMAESLESEDGKAWTLTMREGVKFSDETPYDAEAVVYNWDRIADPATASAALTSLRGTTWKAADDLTVDITLPSVNWLFPELVTTHLAFIGSPTAMDEKGDDFFTQPVGAGPFLLDDWVQGTSSTLVRSETYWDSPRPYLDSITTRIIPEDELRADALRTGEADIDIHFLDQIYEELKAEGYDALDSQFVGGSGMIINAGEAPTDDPAVRQALAKALGSESIVRALYPGASVAETLIDPAYGIEGLEPSYGEDLEGAQQLIDDYLDRTGKSSVNITLNVGTHSAIIKQLGEFAQANLSRLDNVNVELELLDYAALSAKLAQNDFQVSPYAVYGKHPDILHDLYHSKGARNFSGYSNPEVDAALDLTHSSNDPAVVAKAYSDAANVLTLDAAYIPYRQTNVYAQYNGRVNGLVRGGSTQAVRSDLLWVED